MSAESDLLLGMGERLAAKFAELGKRPRADACDYLLRDLTDATNAVARLRTSLLRDPQNV
jgi:hypothetical protein